MTDETKKNEKEVTADKKAVNPLKMAASLKLTVVCLVLLVVLIFWGTVYQADHGLYQAQQKFFYSWFFLAAGFIPFPGTVLVLFVLFFNLVFALIFRIRFRLSNLGNIVTHLGIIILLVGGFFTFYFSEESSLTLREGETQNMSTSRQLWELAIWENKAGDRDVYAIDTEGLAPGDTISLQDLALELKVKEYYENCSYSVSGGSTGNKVINASGLKRLTGKPSEIEVVRNVAGGVFAVNPSADAGQALLLYGDETRPTPVTVNNRSVAFSLRKKKLPMPLSITLVDFRLKLYPNSNIPKSYESTVSIKGEEGLGRDVVISMNKPLRYKDFTFFQSGYFIEPGGGEYTILAVVKNFGRLLPYISSITIFLGLAIHFLVLLLKRKKAQKGNKNISIWLVGLLGLVTWGFAGGDTVHAEPLSLQHLGKTAIMENGRIKPLDTFAQNILKQLSGRDRFQKKPALHWLARVLFYPENAHNDKVFLITNPEVLDSIGVAREGKARDRYNFYQLEKGVQGLRQLAINASNIKEKNRSFIQNEIISLYNKLYIYQQLTDSFRFLFPHPDYTITDKKTLEALQLPEDKKQFSFFEMAERNEKIKTVIASLREKNKEEWSAGEKEISAISERMSAWAGYYRQLPLTIIPGTKKAKESEEKWLSPWDLLSGFYFHGAAPGRELVLMRDFVLAYRENLQDRFDNSLKSFHQLIREQAGDRIRERAISLEVSYNRLDPFYKAKFFYGFSVIFLLLSFIALKKWFYRFGFLLLLGGFLLHLLGVIARMYIMKRPPVTNLYETFIFTGLITALLGMILELYKKKNIGIITGGLAGLVMLMIAGKYALEGDTMGMLVAVLDSNFWLASHVITIILGYAGIVLSGFIGHAYILQKIFRPHKTGLLKNTFQAVYAIQAFGIIFTFLGTVLGGIWADQSWGRFWGWDPKENGALLILIWSALLFHARMAGWIKETGMAFGTIIGVIAVSLAWFGVNLLNVGLHSYGFTSGVARSLFLFIAFEMLFMIVTALMLTSRREGTPIEKE